MKPTTISALSAALAFSVGMGSFAPAIAEMAATKHWL